MRFRKSVRLGKGVRLNVGKRSAGVSFGVRGLRYSVNTSGRRTTSAGIPGTGIYAVNFSGGGSSRRGQSGRPRRYGQGSETAQSISVTPELADRVIPKAGWLSSEAEKRFRDGVVAYLKHDWEAAATAFEQATARDERNISDDFFLAATYVRLERHAEAAPVLERVVASATALPDQLISKYVPGALELDLPITDRVHVRVGFDSIGASLVLAEVYQELHEREKAIGIVQRLHQLLPDDEAVRLSLADLLYDDDDFESLVELTQGVENQNTVTLATLHLRAKALANQGLTDPAAQLLTVCLKKTAKRDPELLKEIRYNRAEAYELLGERRKAKSDWSKLVAEDPFYRDARDRLAAVQA